MGDFINSIACKLFPFSFEKNKTQKVKNESTISIIFRENQNKGLMIRDIRNKQWVAKLIPNRNRSKESGATQQRIIELTRGKELQRARVKEIDTLNEAIAYHNISQGSSGLANFMPEFIAVLDKDGNLIDIEKELKNCGGSIEALCHKPEFKPAYIVIRDLVEQLGEDKVVKQEIKDIKMVRPSLTPPRFERKMHGHEVKSPLYDAVSKFFFKQSGCSFAFQQSTKSTWYTVVINNIKRIMTVRNTKEILNKEFIKLPPDQLKAIKDKLKELRHSMEYTDYAFSDASLLFLPIQKTVEGKKVNDLEIRLIDMTYALSGREVQKKIAELDDKTKITKIQKQFDEMRIDMLHSIDELIEMVQEEVIIKASEGKV